MIRNAELSDYEKINALEKQVFQIHLNARPDLFNPNCEALSFDYFKECLEDENSTILVYEEKFSVEGFSILHKHVYKNHPVYFDMIVLGIEDFCVDESSRGQNIGKKLFEKSMEYAREIGASRLELSVWEFNENALGFYSHLGMKTRLRKMEIDVE